MMTSLFTTTQLWKINLKLCCKRIKHQRTAENMLNISMKYEPFKIELTLCSIELLVEEHF